MLDLDLDLRTVRYRYWKSGGDMRLCYREARRREAAEGDGKREGEGERESSGAERDEKKGEDLKQERNDG